jgi:hypothetical protein
MRIKKGPCALPGPPSLSVVIPVPPAWVGTASRAAVAVSRARGLRRLAMTHGIEVLEFAPEAGECRRVADSFR